MLRRFLFAYSLAILPSSLAAQEWGQIAAYMAYIGPEDMRNSQGQRVASLGGVLQQDRANFHRFGIRHAEDQGDPVFADPAWRARIPDMVAAGGDDRGSLASMARSGRPFTVGVFACGYGSTPSVIFLAAGGDHSGCF